MRRAVLPLVLLVVCAAGCRKGPPADELRANLQARLDADFGKELLGVQDFTRRGSYTFQDEGDERDRLLVYYDAELRFERDYALSNWDQIGVGSLVSALGATVKGVEGVNPDGNRAGDVLAVRGSAAFVRQDDQWQPVAEGPDEAKGATGPVSDELSPYQQRLEAIGAVGGKLQRQGAGDELRRLERDLDRVLGAAQRRLATRGGRVTLATGTAPGAYAAIGRELVAALEAKGVKAAAFETSGSIENCRLVHDREVNFAFAQNDVAYMALHAAGPFANRPPLGDLRAVGTLYPEAVHVVTTGADSLGALRGGRIAIGPEGSGIRVNALQVLAAAGMALTEFADVRALTTSEAAAELAAGRLEGLFATGASPLPAIAKLAGRARVRLLSLDETVIERLRSEHPFFVPITLPPRTYPSVATPVRTVAVTATIVTHASVPGDDVRQLLGTLFAAVGDLSRGDQSAYLIARETAREGLSIPLHPAADGFLK